MAIPRNFAVLAPLLVISYAVFILAVRGDYPRLQNQLSKAPGISAWVKQRQEVIHQGKLQDLSHASPSFAYFRKFVTQPLTQEGGHLGDYVGYYKKFVEYFPNDSDARAFLGLSYYYSNQKDLALEQFQKAQQLNPKSFWHSYNLAVLNYRLEDYAQAAQNLEKAIATNPNENLNWVYRTSLYHQVFWPDSKLEPEFLKGSLLESYQSAYALLKLSYEKLGRAQDAQRIWSKFLRAFKLPESYRYNPEDIRIKIF